MLHVLNIFILMTISKKNTFRSITPFFINLKHMPATTSIEDIWLLLGITQDHKLRNFLLYIIILFSSLLRILYPKMGLIMVESGTPSNGTLEIYCLVDYATQLKLSVAPSTLKVHHTRVKLRKLKMQKKHTKLIWKCSKRTVYQYPLSCTRSSSVIAKKALTSEYTKTITKERQITMHHSMITRSD